MQICWKWRKVVTTEPQKGTFRAFLDSVQYSRTGILRYERIFGPGFVSTGGLETTKVCVQLCACSLEHWQHVASCVDQHTPTFAGLADCSSTRSTVCTIKRGYLMEARQESWSCPGCIVACARHRAAVDFSGQLFCTAPVHA